MRPPYPSDLSDAEWALLAPLLPPPKPTGRPRKWPDRLIADAVFYVLRSGCAWRMLPRDFPPWPTVFSRFRRWRLDGTLRRAHDLLRELARRQAGRTAEPHAAILDSPSAKTTGVGGPARGYDGGKRVKGRKRHILVDVMGLLLAARVHAADIQDREGARLLADAAPNALDRGGLVWADQGYTGALAAWLHETRGWRLEVVRHPDRQLVRYGLAERPAHRFRVLPRRWVVEIVFPQMTKADVLTLGAGRKHVADLHVRVGHDHAVDQELDQLAALREGGVGEAAVDAFAESLQRRRDRREVLLVVGLTAELCLLGGQPLRALLQIRAPALVLAYGITACRYASVSRSSCWRRCAWPRRRLGGRAVSSCGSHAPPWARAGPPRGGPAPKVARRDPSRRARRAGARACTVRGIASPGANAPTAPSPCRGSSGRARSPRAPHTRARSVRSSRGSGGGSRASCCAAARSPGSAPASPARRRTGPG